MKQNINSHENFEGIEVLICNRYKIKFLLHKLPSCSCQRRRFCWTRFLCDSSVCIYL